MKRQSAIALLATLLTLASAGELAAAEIGPRLSLSTRSVRFTQPGQRTTLTVRNTGDRPLIIGGASVIHDGRSSDFEIAPAGPQTLAPGAARDYSVLLRPQVRLQGPGRPRQSFAALQFASNDPAWPRDPSPTLPGIPNVAGVALSASADPPLLSLIVFFPLLGIPLLFFVPAGREHFLRVVALAVSLVPLALAIVLASRFDASLTVAAGNHGLQFVEHVPWIRAFNVEYFVGVDGLSISMVLLSALVSVIAVGASWSLPATASPRGYFSLLLLLEVGMMGVFVALDFFLFFVFWEVMLLPMYFLIGIWGGARKEYAAIKFFLYTLAGSVLMLLAIIALYHASRATTLVDGTPVAHTFDLMKLAHANDFSGEAAIAGLSFVRLCWVLLFIAFAIKVPIVPLHTWLPDAHVEAPTAISIILAGVLLKMGPYGLMRVNGGILPDATLWAADATAVIGALSIVYGSLCAMTQTDLKRMVAYSSVAHMGFCLLGFASGTSTGITGVLVQMFNHGIITSMLFLLVGVIYDRTQTRQMDQFGGIAAVMPRYATLFGLAFMASLGLPGLSGFIGEALVFIGAFPVYRALTLVAALSLVLTAAYHLTAIQKVHFGKFNETWRSALTGHDLTARELATLLPLAALVLVLGFWPMPLISLVSGGVSTVVDLLDAARASLALSR